MAKGRIGGEQGWRWPFSAYLYGMSYRMTPRDRFFLVCIILLPLLLIAVVVALADRLF